MGSSFPVFTNTNTPNLPSTIVDEKITSVITGLSRNSSVYAGLEGLEGVLTASSTPTRFRH